MTAPTLGTYTTAQRTTNGTTLVHLSVYLFDG